MNTLSLSNFSERIKHTIKFHARVFDPTRRAATFSNQSDSDAIQRIYVINLDRKSDRWNRLKRELGRFSERHGSTLMSVVRRFSAIDARYFESDPKSSVLVPLFSLADQLTVDPNPLLQIDDKARATQIKMTRQEIAVALSHIEIWKLVATGDVPYSLVLEDDVYMPHGFARSLTSAWASFKSKDLGLSFDLLYLSFKEVGNAKVSGKPISKMVRRAPLGLWQASGYVLSRQGAQKLLNLLPAYGPIDLWLNLQFDTIDAFVTTRPLIEQRINEPSTNSYSVLPVLSQLGIVTREKPLVPQKRRLVGPVVAVGEPASGLTSLATALSMLGYTCCSDLDKLPPREERTLLLRGRRCFFNAYVNVGSLQGETLQQLAKMYRNTRYILTSPEAQAPSGVKTDQILRLGHDMKDKWSALSEFLEIEYPSFAYPSELDLGQRSTKEHPVINKFQDATDLKSDASPWVLPGQHDAWKGIYVVQSTRRISPAVTVTAEWGAGGMLDLKDWKLRDDTFPSNRALFTKCNFRQRAGRAAEIMLQREETPVRSFTSAAIASRRSYIYGTFSADIRPSNVSGLITGIFLHRNGPRQEIDIEFLGKDTTKLLVNVYFNPGGEGTKLEYGYRGTPTIINLGFDAAAEFHHYEIEWCAEAIRWRVDGRLAYERALWGPTPIPNLPLEFNVNLWHSRSTELAGPLHEDRMPAFTELRSVQVVSTTAPVHRRPV